MYNLSVALNIQVESEDEAMFFVFVLIDYVAEVSFVVFIAGVVQWEHLNIILGEAGSHFCCQDSLVIHERFMRVVLICRIIVPADMFLGCGVLEFVKTLDDQVEFLVEAVHEHLQHVVHRVGWGGQLGFGWSPSRWCGLRERREHGHH